MSTSKRNTAHHGFGRVVGTSDSMNIPACLTGNVRSCRRQNGRVAAGLALRRRSRPAGHVDYRQGRDVAPIMADRTAVLALGSHYQPFAADGDRRDCGR